MSIENEKNVPVEATGFEAFEAPGEPPELAVVPKADRRLRENAELRRRIAMVDRRLNELDRMLDRGEEILARLIAVNPTGTGVL